MTDTEKLTAADELWHELVLNNVGGSTIAEAKWALSMDEAEDWANYFNKRGTANLGLRLEAGFALVAWMLARGFGLRKDDRSLYSQADFMPHMRTESDEQHEQDGEGISFEDALKALQKIGTTPNG